jgi:hypothetical protein
MSRVKVQRDARVYPLDWWAMSLTADTNQGRPTMSPLRAKMIDAMTLAGLAESTQDSYVKAVRRLAAFYRRSPDDLSEEEVRAYLLDLRRRGAARGTFEIARAGLRFLFCQTLDQVWALFGEKKDRPATTEATA